MKPTEHARALGRIESKVDLLIQNTSDQEGRIRGLEKSRSWVRGGLAVLGALWGVFTFFFHPKN